MKFSYYNPVKIFFEKECVKNHGEVFGKCGKKGMLVTGRTSAKKCGAFDDVVKVLEANGISWICFDGIENNPSMESVTAAAGLAKAENVDFVIGIGGGSPIDASKAIAVLARNPEMAVEDLFSNQFTKALPVVAIPTTAGTGSEATPYSVLLSKEKQTKLSFGKECTYPAYALLDAKYTYSLPAEFTISTAVDAFTHVFEGYLAKRSTSISEQFSLEGMEKFGECIPALLRNEYTEEVREKLMYVSLLGGIVISQTGVTIAHGMGYCYTYFHQIPHGKANGLLMKAYIELNQNAAGSKIDRSMEAMGLEGVEDFTEKLERLLGKAPTLTDADVDFYTKQTLMQRGSIANTPEELDEEKIHSLWERVKNA